MKTVFRKKVVLGYIRGNEYGYKQKMKVEVEVKLREHEEGLELSIVGYIWSPREVDTVSLGQNDDTIRELLEKKAFVELYYPERTIKQLLEIWEEWHLNSLKPYCIHQKKIIKEKLQGKVLPYEEMIKIPEMSKCPECGYRYGSKWIFHQLPEQVIEFVKSL